MQKRRELLKHNIILNLKEFYGINVANIVPLFLGADTNALTYKMQDFEQVFY